jgi:hypothetical protein
MEILDILTHKSFFVLDKLDFLSCHPVHASGSAPTPRRPPPRQDGSLAGFGLCSGQIALPPAGLPFLKA